MTEPKTVGILSDSADTIRTMVRRQGSPCIDMRTNRVSSLPNMESPYVDITMPCGERCVLKKKIYGEEAEEELKESTTDS